MNLFDLFTQRKDASFVYDLDLLQGQSTDVYLKQYAINTCASFLARVFSQSEFKTKNKEIYYKLNVRPNPNQSAASFWQELIFKMITDNEVLVIQDDTDDLLIADSYTKNEYALVPDTFSGVVVGNYTFNRTFQMDDVWYLKYDNDSLARYTNALLTDYANLFTRMIDFAMRNKQLRAVVNVDSINNFESQTPRTDTDGKAATSGIQNFINKLFNSFTKNSIAIVPITKGISYDEVSNKYSGSDQQFTDIKAARTEAVDAVAEILGIPPSLIHSSQAEVDQNRQDFITHCLAPLNQKIEDELNAKVISKSRYGKDNVTVWGINKPDPLELSDAIDKLVSSGVFNRDEVRSWLGYDPIPDGSGKKYYITKNYEEATKGGDTDDSDSD